MLREIAVVAIEDLTPHLRRISFGGDALKDFPLGQESAYIKFVFPSEEGRDRVRSYTVRRFNEERRQLDVDFALHDIGGPATAWAGKCQVGDSITISGPGPTKLANFTADWFFFAGDMSSLPAIAANIELLPASAKGYVVIEILSEEDKLVLGQPPEIEILWVVNPHPERGNDLIDAVKAKAWLSGVVSVWGACEFGKMKQLRDYFVGVREVASENRYISSYWKLRASDEEHKRAKMADSAPS